ncbi:hypothetical protein HDU96_009022 [Phlyctochytrium bullatum]|nr:hypothetical protein HDU96_009022 [Phlyctochytrium bullatum]
MSAAYTDTAVTATAWDDFKAALKSHNAAKAAQCFSTTSSSMLVCVPTGGGSDGSQASLLQFLKTMASQQENVAVEREILSTVRTPATLVEEAILTIVHEGNLSWLLPDVKPTRKRIVFPLISIVDFDADGKIRSLRMHWDQATVLRQISVLPNSLYCKSNASETTLPVLGPKIIDKLKIAVGEQENVPPSENGDALGERRESVTSVTSARSQRSEMSNILAGNATAEAVRPSSRVLQRPGGQVHDIFSTEPAPPQRTAIPIDPRRFVQQVNLFDDTPLPAQQARPAAPPSVTGSETEDAHAAGADSAPASRSGRRTYPGRDASSLKFEDASAGQPAVAAAPAPTAASTAQVLAAGSRSSVAGRQHNQSSITFGGPEPMTPAPAAPVPAEVAVPAAGVSSVAAAEGSRPGTSYGAVRDRNQQSAPAVERPSSRVLRPPGGKSSITIG